MSNRNLYVHFGRSTFDHVFLTTIDGAEEFIYVCPGTDGLVYLVKLLKTESLDVNQVRLPVG